jgi:NADH-quinone oxidoreductase subunit L
MFTAKLMTLFDKYVIDGLVNLGAKITMLLGKFAAGFDRIVVDGLVNLTAWINGLFSILIRKFQTGKVQTYLTLVLVFIVVFVMYIFSN